LRRPALASARHDQHVDVEQLGFRRQVARRHHALDYQQARMRAASPSSQLCSTLFMT
jgi:hypothetical protein